jgi:hypothetical protein
MRNRQITVIGQAFNDFNANGVKEVGESGLAGWTILLDGRPTQTDANLWTGWRG